MKLSDAPNLKRNEATRQQSRFDDNFHGVDPQTGRPFSSGIPDGIWIISICYSFAILAGIGLSVASAIFPKPDGPPWIVPGLVALVLFVPAIILMFLRQAIAMFWLGALALLFLAAAVAGFRTMLEAGTLLSLRAAGLAALVVLQTWAAYYCVLLRRDEILR